MVGLKQPNQNDLRIREEGSDIVRFFNSRVQQLVKSSFAIDKDKCKYQVVEDLKPLVEKIKYKTIYSSEKCWKINTDHKLK